MKILVLKTHAIGDLLMTTPALRDLRRAYPSAHITLMTGAWSAPAIRANPHIDALLEFDDRVLLNRSWFGMLRLLGRVQREKFDIAVIFHPSPFLHLFALLAGIPVRYGLTRGGRSRFLTAGVPEDLGQGTYYPVNFQKVVALAGAASGPPELEVHTRPEDEASAAALLAASGVLPGDAFVLVAPGGGRNSKEDVVARRWPAEKFIELLQVVRQTHPGLKIVLTGAAGDAGETGAVAAAFPDAVDLTARTTLPEIYAIVRRARAVLCNDSSLLHVAVACRRPAVAFFGPTGARQRLPEWAVGYAAQSGLVCSPCYVGGAFPGCPIGYRCMRESGPEALRDRLEAALAAS